MSWNEERCDGATNSIKIWVISKLSMGLAYQRSEERRVGKEC